MEIEVKIRALMMDPNSGTPIIILKDVQSDTMLPIWVGAYEANAIALEIEKNGEKRSVPVQLRIDTPIEIEYYRHGGILPFVLEQLLSKA